MAVAFDASTESHTGSTGSASEASFSWTHTPSGTPAGVLVFVGTKANSAIITSVTYGGVTCSAVSGAEAIDTVGEPCRMKAFFIGSSVPAGAQTVTVTRTNNTTVMYAVAYTVTASRDTEIYLPGIVLVQEDGALVEQSVDDGSPGTNSLRLGGLAWGRDGTLTIGSSSTQDQVIDVTAFAFATCHENTAGQGVRSVGWSYAFTDDRAGVFLAVREVAAPSTFPPYVAVLPQRNIRKSGRYR